MAQLLLTTEGSCMHPVITTSFVLCAEADVGVRCIVVKQLVLQGRVAVCGHRPDSVDKGHCGPVGIESSQRGRVVGYEQGV